MAVSTTDSIESYFKSAIPSVFLDRIVLTSDAGSKLKIHGNPHLDQSALGSVGGLSYNIPPPGKGNLHVQIHFSLKAMVPRNKNIRNSWFFNKMFADHYKILIIEVGDQRLYDNISSIAPADRGAAILETSQRQGVESEILSIHNTGLLTMTDEQDLGHYIEKFNKVTMPNGTTVYDIPFNKDFIIENKNPNHLSFFILPYLDFQESTNESTMNKIMSEDTFYGQPIVELVIHNGQTSSDKRLLYDIDRTTLVKKLWHGPVHQMPDGRWMTGDKHSPSDRDLFEEFSDNYLIQDFRSVEKVEKKLFNFTFDKNRSFGKDSLKILNNDDLDINRKTGYFSDFFHSRDEEGNCRFLFSLDILTMAKRNSAFPKLFEHSRVRKSLLNKTKVAALRLYRKEVVGGGCRGDEHNRVVDLDPNGIATQISDLHQDPSVHPNGFLREIKLFSLNSRMDPPYMRHYTGIDYSIGKVGKYRYLVEIDIQDGTIEFVKEKLSELQTLHTLFKGYEDLSKNISLRASNINKNFKVKYFNDISNRFIPEFAEAVATEAPGMKIMISDGKRKKQIQKFIDYYSLFVSDPSRASSANTLTTRESEELLKNLSIMTSPKEGTPKGINYMTRLIMNLISEIQSVLDVVSSGAATKPHASNSSDQLPIRSRAYRKKIITITKEFSKIEEIFNGKIAPSQGTSYINFRGEAGTKTGLSTLTVVDYQQRIDNETLKYFHENATAIKFAEGVENNINDSKYSFLSPSNIMFGPGNLPEVDFLELGQSLKYYKTDVYESALTRILLFNECEDISRPGSLTVRMDKKSAEKYSVQKQELRNVLINYFSKKNCTVDNMRAFRVLQESDIVQQGATQGHDTQQNYYEEFSIMQTTNANNIEFDPKNPNVVFSRLLKEIITPRQTVFSPKETFNAQKDPAIINYIRERTREVPNHIKALVGLYTPSSTTPVEPIARTSLRLKHENINHNSMGFFFFNFFNLAKIEYLQGYAVAENDEAQMSAPIFNIMSQGAFNHVADSERTRLSALCRFKKPTSHFINLPFPKLLNFPMYNEYFLLSPSRTGERITYNFSNQSAAAGSIPTAQEVIAAGAGNPAAVNQSGEVASVEDIIASSLPPAMPPPQTQAVPPSGLLGLPPLPPSVLPGGRIGLPQLPPSVLPGGGTTARMRSIPPTRATGPPPGGYVNIKWRK